MVAWLLEYGTRLKEEGYSEIFVIDLAWNQARYFMKRSAKLIDNLSTYPRTNSQIKKTVEKLGLELINQSEYSHLVINKSGNLTPVSRSVLEKAIRSSYSRYFGSSLIQLSNLPDSIIKGEERSFHATVSIMEHLFKKYGFNLFVTVNGRFTVDAAVLNFAKQNGIDSKALERAPRSLNAYLEFSDSVHSVRERQQLVNEFWSSNENVHKTELAQNWLEHEFNSQSSWHRLQDLQIEEKFLTENYWVYFPTSDWEFSPFSDKVREGEFSDQFEAFETICKLSKELGKKMYVRGHPHPDDLEAAIHEDNLWSKIAQEQGACYIASNSSENSLKMAEFAEMNFTHESTIAVECLWHDFPIVVTGHTPYTHLVREFFAPNSTLLEKLVIGDRKIANIENLHPWAYFQSRAGEELEIFKVINYKEVLFYGQYFLRPNVPLILARQFYVKGKVLFSRTIKKLKSLLKYRIQIAKNSKG